MVWNNNPQPKRPKRVAFGACHDDTSRVHGHRPPSDPDEGHQQGKRPRYPGRPKSRQVDLHTSVNSIGWLGEYH